VKLVTKEIWDKVLADFPAEEERCKNLIKDYSVQRAQEKLGFEPGSTETLRLSAVFRGLSNGLIQKMVGYLSNHLCTPGSEIIRPEQEKKGVYFILAGHVCAQGSRGQSMPSGRVFGETVLLGISKSYPYTVEALSLCTLQFFDKRTFEDILATSKDDYRVVSYLEREARNNAVSQLKVAQGLQKCAVFKNSCPDFIKSLSTEFEDVVFAPGDVVFPYGDPIVYGESPFYFVLAGQVNVMSKLGVQLANVMAVQVFGESVAMPGANERRMASIIAWEVGLVYCGRISGPAMVKAFSAFPKEQQALVQLLESRRSANVDIERERRTWLKETAMPALMEQPIFERCSPQFLWALATPLHETTYAAGKAIVKVGDAAHSMFIILKGDVAVESKTGERVSVITAKASFGEVAMLGILPTRTATLRAVSNQVSMLEVTSLSMQHALSTKYAGKITERFKQWGQLRQEQVALGKPLSLLDINTVASDVSVAAIGIHSQRVTYRQGEIWQAMPDNSPNGPRISIVSHGRANLEMAQNGRKVKSLVPGDLIMEGICSDLGACMRCTTNVCEVYQIFMNDFKIAISTVSGTTPWIWRFKVLEKEARKAYQQRLTSMAGLIEGLAPHPSDGEISAWRNQRQDKINLAKTRRDCRAEGGEPDSGSISPSKLPSISKTEDDAERRDLKAESASPIARTRRSEQSTISYSGIGLSSYPCVNLPCIQHDSAFSKSGKPLHRSARSEILLRRIRE
jgi:CRP-like cAMP-binding protein